MESFATRETADESTLNFIESFSAQRTSDLPIFINFARALEKCYYSLRCVGDWFT